MAKLFKNNGLTIVLMLLFLGSIVGQWIAGWQVQNEELLRHGGLYARLHALHFLREEN